MPNSMQEMNNLIFVHFCEVEFGSYLMVALSPVIEPDLPGAFITDVNRENSLQIPFMTGNNLDDGLIKTSGKIFYQKFKYRNYIFFSPESDSFI